MKPMEEEKVKGEEPSEDAREEEEGVGASSAPQVAANNHGTRVSRHTETNIIFTLLRQIEDMLSVRLGLVRIYNLG